MRTLLVIASFIVMLATGCTTTQQRVSYTTLQSVHIAVDAAMKGWGEYVRTHQHDTTLADKEARVKAMYEEYQRAASTAIIMQITAIKTKEEGSLIQALSVVQAASGPLLQVIGSFTH